MNVFITGGTGLIGRALINSLLNNSITITILTRNTNSAQQIFNNKVNYCSSLDNLTSLDNFDAVINLAGESIAAKRWSVKQKLELCRSRWELTEKLSRLILSSANPPKIFISGSAVGYYGVHSDNILTEDSIANNCFTNYLCKTWESLALNAKTDRTRVCISRTGIVLSSKGGMFPKILLPFKYFVGAVMGKGNQYISWIHIDDMVNALYFLLTNSEANGVFNMVSPQAVTNKNFSKKLASSLHKPCIFKIPKWVLKIFLGESSTLLVDGQRVIPKKLLDMGFKFNYPVLEDAFNTILKEKR